MPPSLGEMGQALIRPSLEKQNTMKSLVPFLAFALLGCSSNASEVCDKVLECGFEVWSGGYLAVRTSDSKDECESKIGDPSDDCAECVSDHGCAPLAKDRSSVCSSKCSFWVEEE